MFPSQVDRERFSQLRANMEFADALALPAALLIAYADKRGGNGRIG